MATTSQHLQLYFGCTAQTPIIGGAGLVRMRMPIDNNFRFRSNEVVPVRTAAAESPLLAGSMFVIERHGRSDTARQSSSLPVILTISVICHVISCFRWRCKTTGYKLGAQSQCITSPCCRSTVDQHFDVISRHLHLTNCLCKKQFISLQLSLKS